MAARVSLVGAAFACLATSAAAGTVTGVVRNGTTGAPAANVDVVLIALQSGMETAANTKTDSQGRYTLTAAEIGTQPMLIRVPYKGVNFHEPLPPGKPTADITIFEPTSDPNAVAVTTHAVVVQPNGTSLLVGEEFTLENKTQPPKAFFNQNGTFDFTIPSGAQLNQVSAMGPSGMPVVQGTIDKGQGKTAIAFAFHPGQNGVRISYELPYSNNQATLHFSSPYAARQVYVVAPPTVQVTGEGFGPAGSEQGMSVFARTATLAGQGFDVTISGTAPPPSPGQGAEGGGGDEGGASGTAQVLPGRMDDLKWILLGGFVGLFALGLVFLLRKPVAAPAMAVAAPGVATPAPRTKKKKAADVVAEADGQVRGNLDELKELLFKLELRRQAGTISEEEYAKQRGRAEKTLRDLVRG